MIRGFEIKVAKSKFSAPELGFQVVGLQSLWSRVEVSRFRQRQTLISNVASSVLTPNEGLHVGGKLNRPFFTTSTSVIYAPLLRLSSSRDLERCHAHSAAKKQDHILLASIRVSLFAPIHLFTHLMWHHPAPDHCQTP
jgi:hypothetical protein